MSNGIYEANRFLKLTSPLGKDELLIAHLGGGEEISSPFKFSLHLISNNLNVQSNQLLGKKLTVTLSTELYSTLQYFHGYVFDFFAGETKEGLRHYTATLGSWLQFLDYTSDCRIFQNKSATDIMRIIFSQYGFSDYDFSKMTTACKERDYCVQYNETALNFITRLMEEEGIFYYIRHEENRHVVVFGQDSTAFTRIADSEVVYAPHSNQSHRLTQWQHDSTFYSGKFSQADYNYNTADQSLHGSQESNAKLISAQKYEIYHYPGNHENTNEAKERAQRRFEAVESHHSAFRGEGNYTSFMPGGRFSLLNAPNQEDNDDYIITSVTHSISDHSYFQNKQGGEICNNKFTCISAKINYRPVYTVKKPRILGSQTAVVVGPEGQEIYTDQYGRVKIQFHWDRLGKKDGYSSCWVRVAQAWAGKNWGTFFLPRIGQEVVVQFIDGDPNKPLIIGSVYNSNNLPAYELPFDYTQSGIKTRSTKDGDNSAANELRFDDKLDQEEIFIQAQRDFNQNVKNNLQVYVGNQCTLEAAQSIELKVGANKLLINTEGIYLNGAEVKINN